jgi:hypothetical protein
MKDSDIIYIALGFTIFIVNGIETACLAGISHCYTQSLIAEKKIKVSSLARAAMQLLKKNNSKSRED